MEIVNIDELADTLRKHDMKVENHHNDIFKRCMNAANGNPTLFKPASGAQAKVVSIGFNLKQ
jgi:hypothetical protein